MDSQKKAWTKPVLIIIGRGTPEEAVLLACKSDTSVGSFSSEIKGCRGIDGTGGACQGQGGS